MTKNDDFENADELIEAEATIDTLIETTAISETRSYAALRSALDNLQNELEAHGIQGKWKAW